MEKSDIIEKATQVSVSSSSSSITTNSQHTFTPIDDSTPPSPSQTPTTVTVSFTPDDPSNPNNWSTTKKLLILLSATLVTTTPALSSTLPSNLSPTLPHIFALPPSSYNLDRVLPQTLFLTGFVFGPLVFAPLSESSRIGRRPVLIVGAAGFVAASLGMAVVGSWEGMLVVRFLAGVMGSPPASVFGGVVADLWAGEMGRGRVLMLWSAATFIGPLGAPILAGYVSPQLGWRAVFWIALSFAVLSLIAVVLLPETLATAILRKKAERLNKESGDTGNRFVSPGELCEGSAWESYKETLATPWRLLFKEMIVSLTCIYTGFIYAVFYMLVQIFPAIFQGVYGFTPGMSGILFTIMGFGTFIACFVCLWFDSIAPRLSARHANKKEEYLRLPLACAGGLVFVVSMLWLGWTARLEIHWLVPLSATIPYGLAYHLIFVAMINYVADAYGIYSASAMAALSMTRSVAGAAIPLAVEDMLAALGIAWSCTVLAGISAGLALVPFGFIAYGEKIRGASQFSARLKPGVRDADVHGGESGGLVRVASRGLSGV